MDVKPQRAFAAVADWGDGRSYLATSSVSYYARDARHEMGRLWHEDPKIGWRMARKRGYRIRRVVVMLEEDFNG